MPDPSDLAAFIGDSFRSIWTLELLLFLKQHAAVTWQHESLVSAMRASDAVVSTSLAQLFAAGLIASDGKSAKYAPATKDLGHMVEEMQRLYVQKPDAVRRLIVNRTTSLSAFADSFRIGRK
jgi:hypothetical protein